VNTRSSVKLEREVGRNPGRVEEPEEFQLLEVHRVRRRPIGDGDQTVSRCA
jgi:hypothetical protein